MRSIICHPVKDKGSKSPRDVCFKCGGAHFQRDSNARKGNGKQSSGKGNQKKSLSKSEGKEKSKESKGESKGVNLEVPKVPKVRTRVKHRKLVLLGLGKTKIKDKLRNSGI